ncbi:MAG: homoserine O-acetyltransferase [Acidobacteria bacterium]|nr:homoserine O-acetyltransferase [Acidobacteriota bacterium]MBW4044843.1 homoserine O-acetyltransferase [Acidobacteriota bacterium]
MTPGTHPSIPKPTFEGDFQLDEVVSLESGEVLCRPTQHYAMYGQLNEARDNAVLVCHALSGSALVAEWWPQLFAPGGLLDLKRDCVIGINIFGSCYGSTGPGSIDPQTGNKYGPTFPLINVRDIVRAQAKLIDSLGIRKLKLAIGASIGGMQVLEWAILFPERVARAISIGVAPLGAMGLGLNHLQRQAIQLDPKWKGGHYAPEDAPRGGLALARALGVISYKSVELFEQRFNRKPNRNGENPWISTAAGQNGRFDVAGFLDYQGEKFNARFDPNSYISITRTMDIFDPVRAHTSPYAAYERIQAHLTLVGISTDWLFPPEDIRSLAAIIGAAGVRCDYREMASLHGHDAFLAEPEQLVRLLTPVFE